VRRCALVAAVVSLIAAGCGSSGSAATFKPAPPGVAKQLMARRLHAKQLDYTWLACISLPRTWRGIPLTRCNVGFGIDPHVEAYCVVLRNGALLTNHEDASIPCRHDDAGWNGTTITSS
jgi:hypothetical protein